MRADLVVRLSEIAAEYNRVERRVKEFENDNQNALTPAINELRYAGRQMVDAWAHAETKEAGYEDKVLSHFTVAKQYLMNADHDVTDGLVAFAQRETHFISRRYKAYFINRYFSDYLELVKLIREAQNVTSISREMRHTRVEKYAEVARIKLPRIMELYGLLIIAEIEVLSAEKRQELVRRVLTIIGLLGVAITIAAWIFPDFGRTIAAWIANLVPSGDAGTSAR